MNDLLRINVGQPTITNKPKRCKASEPEKREARRSPRAIRNFIPSTEEILARIDDALIALSRGIYWDRGAIIDIVL